MSKAKSQPVKSQVSGSIIVMIPIGIPGMGKGYLL
jgi:hypothetical protein